MDVQTEILNIAELRAIGAAIRSDVAVIPPSIDLIGFGDSRIRASWDIAGGIIGNQRPKDILSWICALSYQTFRYRFANNFGVSGDTTAGMLLRIDTVIASPARVVVMMAGVNDFTSATDINTIENYKLLYARLQAAGKQVIHLMETGVGTVAASIGIGGSAAAGNGPLTTAQQKKQQRAIDWLHNEAPKYGVIVIDASAKVIDPALTTYAPAPGMSDDGLHLTPRAAHAIAAEFVRRVLPLRVLGDVRSYYNAKSYDAVLVPYGNLLPNPRLAGTGGTFPGMDAGSVVADNRALTMNNSAGLTTMLASKAVDTDGWPLQRIVLAGTPSATPSLDLRVNGSTTVTTGLYSGDLAPGDKVQMIQQVSVPAGMEGVRAIKPLLRVNYGAGDVDTAMWSPISGQGFMPNVAWDGLLASEPIPIQAGTIASLSFRTYEDLQTGAVVASTLNLGATELRKVLE